MPAYDFHWTEQITKAIVILVLAPLVLYKAVIYQDLTLGLIGALMLVYDGYWAVKYKLVQREKGAHTAEGHEAEHAQTDTTRG